MLHHFSVRSFQLVFTFPKSAAFFVLHKNSAFRTVFYRRDRVQKLEYEAMNLKQVFFSFLYKDTSIAAGQRGHCTHSSDRGPPITRCCSTNTAIFHLPRPVDSSYKQDFWNKEQATKNNTLCWTGCWDRQTNIPDTSQELQPFDWWLVLSPNLLIICTGSGQLMSKFYSKSSHLIWWRCNNEKTLHVVPSRSS